MNSWAWRGPQPKRGGVQWRWARPRRGADGGRADGGGGGGGGRGAHLSLSAAECPCITRAYDAWNGDSEGHLLQLPPSPADKNNCFIVSS